jgi:hypothetical protein
MYCVLLGYCMCMHSVVHINVLGTAQVGIGYDKPGNSASWSFSIKTFQRAGMYYICVFVCNCCFAKVDWSMCTHCTVLHRYSAFKWYSSKAIVYCYAEFDLCIAYLSPVPFQCRDGRHAITGMPGLTWNDACIVFGCSSTLE